jgi:hypothetical protein
VRWQDIFRREIAYHFFKLIAVYIIGLALFLVLCALFLITSLLVPWRCQCNYKLIRIVIQKVRIKKKDPENLFMLLRGVISNIAYVFLDFGLLIAILLYALTSVLVFWRIYRSYSWYRDNLERIKASLYRRQNYDLFVDSDQAEGDAVEVKPISQFEVILLLLYQALIENLILYMFLDILTLCLIIPNFIGFWRLPSLWAHRAGLR